MMALSRIAFQRPRFDPLMFETRSENPVLESSFQGPRRQEERSEIDVKPYSGRSSAFLCWDWLKRVA
jgi:hypothetical protein